MSGSETDGLTADLGASATQAAHKPAIWLPPLNGMSASAALRRLADEPGPERISLDHILTRLSDRAFGIILVVLAAPNLLPMPPGVSTVLGLLIFLVAVQVLLGRHRLWVPASLRRRSIARQAFQRIVKRFAPLLERIERLCRPRALWVTAGPTERLLGLVTILLAIVIAVPIPFIGQAPPAIVIGILSVSMIERDGVLVLAGIVLAFAVIALNLGVVWAALVALLKAASGLLSQLGH
jgi:hypothetical protein